MRCGTHGLRPDNNPIGLGYCLLTHWGRVTHICVSRLTLIVSDNGLSPDRRQSIIWTNDGIRYIGPLGINFSEMLIKIYTFSFRKMHLKISSRKWRSFCLDLSVNTGLQQWSSSIKWMSVFSTSSLRYTNKRNKSHRCICCSKGIIIVMNWLRGHEDTDIAPCSICSSVVVVTKTIFSVPIFSRCLPLSKFWLPISYQLDICHLSLQHYCWCENFDKTTDVQVVNSWNQKETQLCTIVQLRCT